MTGPTDALDLTHTLWRFLTSMSGAQDETERARLTATAIPAVVPGMLCGVALWHQDEGSWHLVLIR